MASLFDVSFVLSGEGNTSAICGNGRATKKEVSRVMVSKYPELKVYLTQDRAWKERYHQNMFDAVALGLMALSQGVLDRAEKKSSLGFEKA